MNQALLDLCDEFLANEEIIKSQYFGGYNAVFPVCSYIFLSKKETPNPSSIQYCKSLMKEEFSIFSSFRAIGEKIFTCILATDPDPERKLSLTLAAYDFLRRQFHASYFLPVLALWMTDHVPSEDYDFISEKAKTIYQCMKEDHMFLTTSEDVPFAGLLAMSDRDEDLIMREIEYIYHRIDNLFPFHKNAKQSLSHALTLCYGDPDEKCDAFISLYKDLQENGLKYGKSFEMLGLAILANVGIDRNTLIRDFIQVDQYLSTQPEYRGVFAMGRQSRHLHTAMILMSYHMADNVEAVNSMILCALLEIQAQQSAAAAAAA